MENVQHYIGLENVYTKPPTSYIIEIRGRIISEKKQAFGHRHDFYVRMFCITNAAL